MPARYQRRRTKGSRVPDGAVYVGRPGRYGNIVRVGDPDVPDAKTAVERYRQYLRDTPQLVDEIRHRLRGKDVACWCPVDQECHGTVILRVAAGGEP